MDIRRAILERIAWARRNARDPRGVVLDPINRHVDLSWLGLPVAYEVISGHTTWLLAMTQTQEGVTL